MGYTAKRLLKAMRTEKADGQQDIQDDIDLDDLDDTIAKADYRAEFNKHTLFFEHSEVTSRAAPYASDCAMYDRRCGGGPR